MPYEHNELFSKLFKQDIAIPQNTLDVLDRVCANLEDNHTGTSDKRYPKTGKRSFVILVAAIIATMLFAGTVFAYGLSHSELFQSIFGTGVSGNDEDRTYYSSMGVERQFPLNERVEVDEETAEQLVGEYIVPLNTEFS